MVSILGGWPSTGTLWQTCILAVELGLDSKPGRGFDGAKGLTRLALLGDGSGYVEEGGLVGGKGHTQMDDKDSSARF